MVLTTRRRGCAQPPDLRMRAAGKRSMVTAPRVPYHESKVGAVAGVLWRHMISPGQKVRTSKYAPAPPLTSCCYSPQPEPYAALQPRPLPPSLRTSAPR